MKIKMLGVTLMATAALVGCTSPDENNGTETNDNNVEQTRYNAGDGNGMENQENRQGFDMNQDNNNENRGTNNDNEYDMSDEAAEKITSQVNEIEGANVVTTENNAYVAAELDSNDNGNNTAGNGDNNGDELTDEVKQQISDIVKSVDKDIDNVYVSTNPDFGDLVTNYADQAENGEPIEGLFDQMGNMIERVFPQDNN